MKKFNCLKNIKSQAGFTLSESVIAIMLVVVSLVGILNLINRAGGFMNVAFSQLIATNLSQEGIELVRNARDNNWINGKIWTKDIVGCENGMKVDYIDGLSCLGSDEESVLLFDENSGYNHTVGKKETPYKRKILITEDNPGELKVQSIVNWNMRGTTFEVKSEDHLYNWY